jgi:hypothetical protein
MSTDGIVGKAFPLIFQIFSRQNGYPFADDLHNPHILEPFFLQVHCIGVPRFAVKGECRRRHPPRFFARSMLEQRRLLITQREVCQCHFIPVPELHIDGLQGVP